MHPYCPHGPALRLIFVTRRDWTSVISYLYSYS